MLPINDYRLNHFPRDILNSISKELDFNSCRNFRLTCKDIYYCDSTAQTQQALAEEAFQAGRLHLAPTPLELYLNTGMTPINLLFPASVGVAVVCGLALWATGTLSLPHTLEAAGATVCFGTIGSMGSMVTAGCYKDDTRYPEEKLLEFDPERRRLNNSPSLEAVIVDGESQKLLWNQDSMPAAGKLP